MTTIGAVSTGLTRTGATVMGATVVVLVGAGAGAGVVLASRVVDLTGVIDPVPLVGASSVDVLPLGRLTKVLVVKLGASRSPLLVSVVVVGAVVFALSTVAVSTDGVMAVNNAGETDATIVGATLTVPTKLIWRGASGVSRLPLRMTAAPVINRL